MSTKIVLFKRKHDSEQSDDSSSSLDGKNGQSKLQSNTEQVNAEDSEEFMKPTSGKVKISLGKGKKKHADLADYEEESKVNPSERENSLVLGKRPIRRWEKRWVLQQNVLDLNKGDIWVQRWIPLSKAEEHDLKLD